MSHLVPSPLRQSAPVHSVPLPRCRVIALAALSLAACLGALPNPAAAQPAWPSKPIRFVVLYPPGGQLDQVSRALSEQLREPLGQPVVIENRLGGGGNIGADLVAKSASDRYSIVMGAVA